MSGVLLQARRPCTIQFGDRAHVIGASAAGEALSRPEWTAVAAGAYFRVRPGAADMLIRQGLATEAVGPDYLRPLIATVLPARAAAEAAVAAMAAGIVTLAQGEGLAAFRQLRSPEEAARIFSAPGAPDPVFRLEQVVAAGRLPRHFAWRSGAVCEVSSQPR